MTQEKIKYIQIFHWDYWYDVYDLYEDGTISCKAVEFSITEDEAGEDFFFHFDFYNLPALRETIQNGEYVEPEKPHYEKFLSQAEGLYRKEYPYFIGSLYYPDFFMDMSSLSGKELEDGEKTIFDYKSPAMSPHYAVVFLGEERPLTPDVLQEWTENLSPILFKEKFSCKIAHIPAKEEALSSYQRDFL